ncbi:MAG TPA: RNB domain-containing ribonuclease [Candidatus Didemnitutus sp.]|nr:RNB domain-containing ribonuclease [Candidatus Didemnitutus sp.]
MNFEQRLLQYLRQPDYVPAPADAVARHWRLKTKDRRRFFAEINRLVHDGRIVLVKGNRLCLPQTADLVTGRIQFRQSGSAIVFPEGKVTEARKDPIQIAAENTGVALHGDTVVVRLITGREREQYRFLKQDEQAGKVIEILERGNATITGTLQRGRLYFYVAPDDPRVPHDIIVGDPMREKFRPLPVVGDKVVVRLAEWTDRGRNPTGTITERLGRTFEPRAELAAIYHKYELSPNFPADVLAEANQLPDRVRPADLAGRQDFRTVPTFTIDPDDAKDFDDALSIENLPGGDVRVGIHIADVSAYVKRGTALDREARRRGNSTYLVGTVVPMLPEKLSNGLCSLVEAQDRLTKATIITFAPHGRIKHVEYANTVIRSFKRLTYRQAYALMFENDLAKIRKLPLPAAHQTGSTGRALSEMSDDDLSALRGWVRQLWSIAERLRSARMRAGSLDLDMPETKIFVDAQGYADRLELIHNDESHQLIEEFMLLANEAVARLTKQQRLPSLYRVHDDPDETKLNDYRQLAATHGIKVGDLSRREEMVRLLQILKDHPRGFLLRTQLLRSMRKACYRSSPDGHYGLAKKDYTHFTSPIRRYADLVVHRVLQHYLTQKAAAGGPPAKIVDAAGMDALAEHLSLTEINSTEAERDSVKVKLMEFFERELQKKKKTVFPAVITEVRNHGFFVELTEAGGFGMVPISSLGDDFYLLSGDGTQFVGRKNRRRFELGQKIGVVVLKVDRQKRLVDFTVPKD